MKRSFAWYVCAGIVVLLGVLHLRDFSVFSRSFLNFDDQQFIAPLAQYDIWTYFTEWAAQPDHYVFPLRDLTFGLDFVASRWFSFSTFWLTNFVLYSLYVFLVAQIFSVFYGSRPLVVGSATALVALHPLNVEMIQWASNRKHLLVGLILGWGTLRVFRQWQEGQAVRSRDWRIYFGIYIAAWLCWPSAVLWIFWVLWAFRTELKGRGSSGIALLVTAIVLAVTGVLVTIQSNSTYALESSGANWEPWTIALQAVGRGFFSLIYPFRLVPYYQLGSPLNWIGLFLFILTILLSARRMKNIPADRRPLARLALGLMVAHLIPQFKVILGYTEFVWSDRYLFGALPFIALFALFCLFPTDAAHAPSRAGRGSKKNEGILRVGTPAFWRKLGLTAAFAISVSFAWKTAGGISIWKDDLKLFSHCAMVSESSKCLTLAIEKNFDRSGCQDLEPYFEISRNIAPKAIHRADFMFRAQLPLYESLCVADRALPPPQKLSRIREVEATYPTRNPAYRNVGSVVGEVLIHLQNKDISQAYGAARATYLNPKLNLFETMPKVVNLLRGQGNALCAIHSALMQTQDCWKELSQFNTATLAFAPNEAQIEWSQNRVVRAYNDGL